MTHNENTKAKSLQDETHWNNEIENNSGGPCNENLEHIINSTEMTKYGKLHFTEATIFWDKWSCITKYWILYGISHQRKWSLERYTNNE